MIAIQMPEKRSMKIPGFVQSMDIFKRPLPAFNIRGRSEIGTVTGALLSFLLIIILLFYSMVKISQLISQTNPTISSFTTQNYFDASNVINF